MEMGQHPSYGCLAMWCSKPPRQASDRSTERVSKEAENDQIWSPPTTLQGRNLAMAKEAQHTKFFLGKGGGFAMCFEILAEPTQERGLFWLIYRVGAHAM